MKELMKYYSSICLLCKDENEYINEWIEWHLSIGIEHFYIYDNNSQIPLSHSIDNKYLNLCTIIPFDYTIEKYRNIQRICYTKCLQSYGNESEWIAFIDTDEFIKLYTNEDINTFLKKYENYKGIYIDWLVYNASGQVKKEKGNVKDRFTNTIEFPYKEQPRGKCIIRPKFFLEMDAHYPTTPRIASDIVDSDYNKVYQPPRVKEHKIATDKIILEHYMTRSYEEWIEKIKRGSLMQGFERKLDEFFLFNKDLEYLRSDINERVD